MGGHLRSTARAKDLALQPCERGAPRGRSIPGRSFLTARRPLFGVATGLVLAAAPGLGAVVGGRHWEVTLVALVPVEPELPERPVPAREHRRDGEGDGERAGLL